MLLSSGNERMSQASSFDHQRRVFQLSKDYAQFAIFWEQGTGKTKLMLDTAQHLREQMLIDAVLVLAPNGVHRVWIEDELPKWWDHGKATFPLCFKTGMANSRRGRLEMDAAIKSTFPFVAMSYDSLMTKKGHEWAMGLLRSRRVFLVADESTQIKSPAAKRTRRAVSMAKHAPFKRILTGTPYTRSPFDAYSQICFLDVDFWRRAGFKTLSEFRNHFGVFQTQPFASPRTAKNGRVMYNYSFVSDYRNLDELKRLLDTISSRVTKEDTLDLPPKLYSKRYFEMTPEQKRAYNDLRESYMTMLHTGDVIDAVLPIVRLLRFHQITCNYLPTEEGQLVDIGPVNPRLRCLETLLEEVDHSAIIWARFRRDIDLITEMLKGRCVRYDGSVDEEARAAARNEFQAGRVQFFVANPAVGATGLTLTAARTVIYYNNDFRLENRLQSEDRAHRIGQSHPVNYVDLVCPDTVDVHIVKNLVNKMDVASVLTGDRLKEWI